VKIKRIADLIQVNMRNVSGNKTFKMSECSTYMRIESSVSINICLRQNLLCQKSSEPKMEKE